MTRNILLRGQILAFEFVFEAYGCYHVACKHYHIKPLKNDVEPRAHSIIILQCAPGVSKEQNWIAYASGWPS